MCLKPLIYQAFRENANATFWVKCFIEYGLILTRSYKYVSNNLKIFLTFMKWSKK